MPRRPRSARSPTQHAGEAVACTLAPIVRLSQNRSCRPHTGLAVLPVHAVVASLVPAAGHRSRLAQHAPLSPPRALLAAPRHLHAASSGHKSKHCAVAACGPGSCAIARASGHRSQHGGRLGDGPTVRRRDALQRPARARSSSSAGREGRACRKIYICLFVCLFVCLDGDLDLVTCGCHYL